MSKKEYSRDKRSPKPKSESVSKVMSANKSRNTSPELVLRQFLWKNGIKGYRLNYKAVPGKPDIAFVAKKIAVFVNGCFWHRCPKCNYSLPKHNTEFWKKKFEANITRDRRKADQLQDLGWQVIVVWECDIKSGLIDIARTIKNSLDREK